jgi:predicted ArsR family transcriptional regulator
MHETRKQILEVLDSLGVATVEQIVSEIERKAERKISTVTVRYHLGILQDEGYLSDPKHLERTSRGRPQHVFSLTPKPNEPHKNYAEVLLKLFQAGAGVNNSQLMAEIGVQIAKNASDLRTFSLSARFDAVVEFLNQRGYDASWEETSRGVILTTGDCPYHDIAQHTEHLCTMDMSLIAHLVGSQPQRLTRIAGGDATCSYWFDATLLE